MKALQNKLFCADVYIFQCLWAWGAVLRISRVWTVVSMHEIKNAHCMTMTCFVRIFMNSSFSYQIVLPNNHSWNKITFRNKCLCSRSSIHPDSAAFSGSATQAAAAVCGSAEPRFPKDNGPAAADGLRSAVTASCPRAAQTCSSPAFYTEPAGYHLPLHYQPTCPSLLPQPCQSSACPAHCHQPTNPANGTYTNAD